MTVTIILPSNISQPYILPNVVNVSEISNKVVLTFSDGRTTSYEDATVSINIFKTNRDVTVYAG